MKILVCDNDYEKFVLNTCYIGLSVDVNGWLKITLKPGKLTKVINTQLPLIFSYMLAIDIIISFSEGNE